MLNDELWLDLERTITRLKHYCSDEHNKDNIKLIWLAKNKEEQLARIKANNKEQIELNRRFVTSYKERHPCPCGEADIRCLDFHHKNGEDKEFSISRMVNSGCALLTLAKEMAKCVILCSNCHRKLHAPLTQGLECRVL